MRFLLIDNILFKGKFHKLGMCNFRVRTLLLSYVLYIV